MVPVCRPSMPLSTGPTLFLAPSPTEWQGRHFLKEFSPAARSCADAGNADAASMNAPSAILVIVAPVVYSNPVEGLRRYRMDGRHGRVNGPSRHCLHVRQVLSPGPQ